MYPLYEHSLLYLNNGVDTSYQYHHYFPLPSTAISQDCIAAFVIFCCFSLGHMSRSWDYMRAQLLFYKKVGF